MNETKPKRKSKGKRHPAHAESFDLIANALALLREDMPISRQELITILRGEAERLRTILR